MKLNAAVPLRLCFVWSELVDARAAECGTCHGHGSFHLSGYGLASSVHGLHRLGPTDGYEDGGNAHGWLPSCLETRVVVLCCSLFDLDVMCPITLDLTELAPSFEVI